MDKSSWGMQQRARAHADWLREAQEDVRRAKVWAKACEGRTVVAEATAARLTDEAVVLRARIAELERGSLPGLVEGGTVLEFRPRTSVGEWVGTSRASDTNVGRALRDAAREQDAGDDAA